MFPKFAPLFVLMVFALVSATGCVAMPVSSRIQGDGTPGEPIVLVETAVAPAKTPAAEPTGGARGRHPVTGTEPPGTAVAPSATITPTAAATATTSVMPAATALAAVAAAATATTAAINASPAPAAALEHYQGPNPYRAAPQFDIAYDQSAWEYVEDDGSGRRSQLKHRMLQGCTLWLRAGPVDGTEVATVWRAERAWSVVQVQPKIIQYVSPQEDFAWIFGLLMPEEFTGRASSTCEDAAGQVIDTFRVL